jgi:hypothetical protein
MHVLKLLFFKLTFASSISGGGGYNTVFNTLQ